MGSVLENFHCHCSLVNLKIASGGSGRISKDFNGFAVKSKLKGVALGHAKYLFGSPCVWQTRLRTSIRNVGNLGEFYVICMYVYTHAGASPHAIRRRVWRRPQGVARCCRAEGLHCNLRSISWQVQFLITIRHPPKILFGETRHVLSSWGYKLFWARRRRRGISAHCGGLLTPEVSFWEGN